MKTFKLDNEPKIAAGFTTPNDYFDTFSSKVLAQVPKQNSKVISVYRFRKSWYIAAAIVIVLLTVPMFTHYLSREKEIDSATLENYLASNTNVSEEEIVNLLDQQDLEKIKIEFHVQDKDIEEALDSNPNLEQYILD